MPSKYTLKLQLRNASCQVHGCENQLHKAFYKRYKVCEEHANLRCIELDGKQVRFCKHCGRFHNISAFDGDRKGCRAMLAAHNERRKRRVATAEGLSSHDFSHLEGSSKEQDFSGTQSQCLANVPQETLIFRPSAISAPSGLVQKLNPLQPDLLAPTQGPLKRARLFDLQTTLAAAPVSPQHSQFDSAFILTPLATENVMFQSSTPLPLLSELQRLCSLDVDDDLLFDMPLIPELEELPSPCINAALSHLTGASKTAVAICGHLASKSSGDFASLAMQQLFELESAVQLQQSGSPPINLSTSYANSIPPGTESTSILRFEDITNSNMALEDLAGMAVKAARQLHQAAVNILETTAINQLTA